MPLKQDGQPTEWMEIDRYDGGVGWIAHPKETMQRASHAIAVDGDVWVLDPVDVDGLDDLLAEFGDIAGVVVLLDRHKRDAAAIARRHDVSVHVPDFMADIEDDLDAPVTLFHRKLGDTDYAAYPLVDNVFWKEAALYGEDDEVLFVPETVGTVDYFLAGDERLGVHPMLRLKPSRKLARLDPERVLVGHGEGIHEDTADALHDAISGSRRKAPGLYLSTLRSALPL